MINRPAGFSKMRVLVPPTAATALGDVQPIHASPRTILAAREVFLTGTTTFVMPVVQIDATTIANGAPGSIARDLRDRYATYVAQQTATDAAWTV